MLTSLYSLSYATGEFYRFYTKDEPFLFKIIYFQYYNKSTYGRDFFFTLHCTNMRVPNRFFGIRDLAYFKAGIRDFEGKGGRDSGL